jgi:PAS domain S-box-containing protein
MKDPQLKSNAEPASLIIDNCMVSALKHITSGVVAVDRSGEVVLFNHAAETITGFDRDKVLGNPYKKFPFAELDGKADSLSRVLAGETAEAAIAERIIGCKDGRKIPVESMICLVIDEKGEPVGALEIFNDLSAVNQLKEEVSKSRTLSALGEMSANVAHEIRNPLGSIGGFAALLERDLDDDDPRRNLVKKIIEGVASLDKIVTNLLIYTRPMKADLRWTNLVEYVNEVLAYLEIEIESQTLPIRIKRKFPSQPVSSRIDPSLMQQVLLNIFHNAVHAMKDGGGCLTICLSRAQDGAKGQSQVNRTQKEFVELLVEDEGVGMSEEVQKKIFNPFFTTREDGTGLGLAIAKKMIQEQNGTIQVFSRPGVGTKITILLPYYP